MIWSFPHISTDTLHTYDNLLEEYENALQDSLTDPEQYPPEELPDKPDFLTFRILNHNTMNFSPIVTKEPGNVISRSSTVPDSRYTMTEHITHSFLSMMNITES